VQLEFDVICSHINRSVRIGVMREMRGIVVHRVKA
jgi:hypothetical protein